MADFKPRGAPVPTPYEDPYAGWELIHRNAMTPAGVYQKGDETAYGWAVPGMISEPANALYRLLDTPAGTMPNPQNEQNQQDALIGLLSLYGGNALKGMAGARGAARVAATLGDMEAPRAVSYGNMIDDALSNPNMLRMMDDINYADLNRRALDDYGVGYEGLSSSQEAKLRGWSDPALLSDTGKPNPVGAAVAGHLPMDEASRMARAREMGFDTDAFHVTRNQFDAFQPNRGGRGASFFASSPEAASVGARSGQNELEMLAASTQDTRPSLTMPVKIKSSAIEGLSLNDRQKAFFDALPSSFSSDQAAIARDTARKQFGSVPDWLFKDETSINMPDGRVLSSNDLSRLSDAELDDVLKNGQETFFKGSVPSYSYQDAVKSGRNIFGGQIAHWGPTSDEAGTAKRILNDGFGGYLIQDEAGVTIAVADPSNIRSVNAAFDPAKADSSFLLASDTGKPNPVGAGVASHLDMSPEARLARAREQGFDTNTTWYHGSFNDFDAFDPKTIGDNFAADDKGFFFSNVPSQASDYALSDTVGLPKDGGMVYPTHIKFERPLIVDESRLRREGIGGVLGKTEDPISFWDNYQGLLKEWAAKEGADGITIVDNSYKVPHGPNKGQSSMMHVAFNPEDIRSVNAAFDPAKAGQNGLLLSDTGKPNPLGAALASQDPDNTNALAELLKRYGVY